MDNTQNKPGKKMIVSMLRVIDRYAVEKALSRAVSKCQNPLDSTFLLRKAIDNQRNHERLAMHGQVNLNKDQHFIVGDCKDISASGLFVACYPDDFIQVNDHINIIIRLQDHDQVFRANGKITRQERNGYAISFITA